MWDNEIPASKFSIPTDYREDPYRFPDLWYFLELTLIHILTSLRSVTPQNDLWLRGRGQQRDGKGDNMITRQQQEQESYVALDIPLSNLGDSSAQMTLLF